MIYKGPGGVYEIVSFTLEDISEDEEIYEGYAVEYADEEDIDTPVSADTLEEINSEFYSDENRYYMTQRSEGRITENVVCEAETGRVIAVSHFIG